MLCLSDYPQPVSGEIDANTGSLAQEPKIFNSHVFLRFSLKSIRKIQSWYLLASLPVTRSASASRGAESNTKNVLLETHGERRKKASYRRTREECLIDETVEASPLLTSSWSSCVAFA